MVDPRAKGARGEKKVLTLFNKVCTDMKRTPMSGALEGLKGDLFIPLYKNRFLIEVKNYKEDPLHSTILHNKSSLLKTWFTKLIQQSEEMKAEPLLAYTYNRGKVFMCISSKYPHSKKLINRFKDKPFIQLNEWFYIFILDNVITQMKEEDLIEHVR